MENKLASPDSRKPTDLDVRLDDENEIPSIFSCRHRTEAAPQEPSGSHAERCFELLKTKHKIFLSHSGAEKSFVEQLCVDLEKSGYFFPFFDQRSHSLPKGETFATLILEAARQCHVAVIVLSETFLTSKWPMIELGEFYKARKPRGPPYLLPLFFKLSIEDLDEQSIKSRWMPEWEKFAAVDERIDLVLWKESVKDLWKWAVEELLRRNGFVFEQAKPPAKPSTGIVYRSEVKYRRAVRDEILKLSPPDLLYGSRESMVGYERLCQMLRSQFVEEKVTGVLLLGLYGMPGLGKTEISKALCDYFRTEFGMTRVCLVKLSNVFTEPLSNDKISRREAEVLKHRKKVLKKLWCLEAGALNDISDIKQAWTLMRDSLKRDRGNVEQEPSAPVLLVIDNVGGDDYSVNEAREYLEAGFPPGSRIMVTSRGRNIVESLLPDATFCKPVPDLTDEEARKIFLKGQKFSLTGADLERIVGLCVDLCRFSVDGAFRSDAQYHPLALQALANFCLSKKSSKKSLSSWEEDLKAFRRSCPDLIDILELQFQSMDRKTEQLVFLDIALFGREWYLADGSDWCSWLAQLHNTDSESVQIIVRQLQHYGMISCTWALTMHQLYREFAVRFVTKGKFQENEWCVSDPTHNERTRRIRMANLKGRIPASRLKREWEYLVLLQLHSCTDIEELNLTNLEMLCHLELINLTKMKALILAPESDSLRFVWLSGLDSLQHLPDFRTCCVNLEVMMITRCLNMSAPVGNITDCKELKSLHVDTGLYQALGTELATSLGSNLMKLEMSNFNLGEEDVLHLGSLGRCDNLEWLILKSFPVKGISGLEELKGLQRFGSRAIFYHCDNLDEAPEGVSQIHNVYRISPHGVLFTKHRWEKDSNRIWGRVPRNIVYKVSPHGYSRAKFYGVEEVITRGAVVSHYVNRWGSDEDFCDYGAGPKSWAYKCARHWDSSSFFQSNMKEEYEHWALPGAGVNEMPPLSLCPQDEKEEKERGSTSTGRKRRKRRTKKKKKEDEKEERGGGSTSTGRKRRKRRTKKKKKEEELQRSM